MTEQDKGDPVKTHDNGNIKVFSDGSITYPMWVRGDMFMTNRQVLGPNDPDQEYNYLKRHGIVPEDYGVVCPMTEKQLAVAAEYTGHGREALLKEIVELREELDNMARYCT